MKNIAIFLFTLILIISCSKNETIDPSIDDVTLCTSVNSSNYCTGDFNQFDPGTIAIYASVQVIDALPDVQISFEWYYASGDVLFAQVTENLSKFGDSGEIVVPGFVSIPNNGWPSGEYSVTVSLSNGPTLSRNFFIN